MPVPQLVYYLCALLISSVICAMGAYSLEHARRTAWLEARMLAEHALHDGLTGIHNRRRFDEHLQRVWQQGRREHKPVSLLFADIDHFKKYNDRYGHQAGDEALKAVAAVLARHARRPFDLAARFGGEEFAVLLYDAGPRDASRIAAEALEEVRALGLRHEDSPADGLLTISIGVATAVPQANRSAAGLLQLADQALYAAKDGGRNQLRGLADEYEQMQTGYFHRRMASDGASGDAQ
jgi:diguanylate cyclase (GGDEF)-like protein